MLSELYSKNAYVELNRVVTQKNENLMSIVKEVGNVVKVLLQMVTLKSVTACLLETLVKLNIRLSFDIGA